jgi:hypothetical protein
LVDGYYRRHAADGRQVHSAVSAMERLHAEVLRHHAVVEHRCVAACHHARVYDHRKAFDHAVGEASAMAYPHANVVRSSVPSGGQSDDEMNILIGASFRLRPHLHSLY